MCGVCKGGYGIRTQTGVPSYCVCVCVCEADVVIHNLPHVTAARSWSSGRGCRYRRSIGVGLVDVSVDVDVDVDVVGSGRVWVVGLVAGGGSGEVHGRLGNSH